MKLLIYVGGLLVSSALVVVLGISGVMSTLGSVGANLLASSIYCLGVYVIPRLIIKRLQKRVPEKKPSTSTFAESEHKPVRSDFSGYQFEVYILLCFSIISVFQLGSKSAEIEKLETQLEKQYHDRYEEGYDEGYDYAYSAGYEDGETDCRSAIVSAYSGEFCFFRNYACIVTEKGSRYHHYGCYHILGRESYIYNIELAEYKGYTPCLDCWDDGLITLTK